MTGKSDPGSSFRKNLTRVASNHNISLTEAQLHALEIHYLLLQIWGRRMNLTAIHDPLEVIRRHFLEGLIAGAFLRRFKAEGTLLDLGSGNGFPAVPIRVTSPEAAPLVLVESSRKKAAFLKALLREEGWLDSRVEVRRVESGTDLRDLTCDIFTIRAVTPFPLLKEGLPFLRDGGSALLFLRRSLLELEFPRLPDGLTLIGEQRLEGRETGLILLQKC